MKHFYNFIRRNPVWSKVLLFSFTLFLIRIADGIISFWAPNQIQNFLQSSVLMGLIISFQSVVGLLADLVFPKFLGTTRVKRLVFWGIIASLATSLLLVGSSVRPFVALFVVTMAFWGIYYELIAFATYQFMGSVVPIAMRSGAWGVSGIFSNLAYFLGPLVATLLLLKGSFLTFGVISGLLAAGLVILLVSKNMHDGETQINLVDINPWVELKHWLTLAEHVWPALVISLLLGFIDSTFWTTGAVYTERLTGQNPWGSLFLPFYQLPPVFLGLVVARWGIYKGKKILTEKFLIVAGFFLLSLAVNVNIFWQLSMVFIASIVLSVCYPLLEGVYTDIVARMGHEKKDMIGLTSSVVNLSYVVWPPIAGIMASQIGERFTFSYLGLLVILTAIGLLFVTPKKLRLPQEEIKKWDKER